MVSKKQGSLVVVNPGQYRAMLDTLVQAGEERKKKKKTVKW